MEDDEYHKGKSTQQQDIAKFEERNAQLLTLFCVSDGALRVYWEFVGALVPQFSQGNKMARGATEVEQYSIGGEIPLPLKK